MNDASSNQVNLTLRLLGSGVLLLSGLIVYWLYRPEIVLFELMHISNPNPIITGSTFELLLKNYFADAVWCLALVQVITVLRECRVPRGYRQVLAVLPFFSETMQSLGGLPWRVRLGRHGYLSLHYDSHYLQGV